MAYQGLRVQCLGCGSRLITPWFPATCENCGEMLYMEMPPRISPPEQPGQVSRGLPKRGLSEGKD